MLNVDRSIESDLPDPEVSPTPESALSITVYTKSRKPTPAIMFFLPPLALFALVLGLAWRVRVQMVKIRNIRLARNAPSTQDLLTRDMFGSLERGKEEAIPMTSNRAFSAGNIFSDHPNNLYTMTRDRVAEKSN
jgi:hypothetical protein